MFAPFVGEVEQRVLHRVLVVRRARDADGPADRQQRGGDREGVRVLVAGGEVRFAVDADAAEFPPRDREARDRRQDERHHDRGLRGVVRVDEVLAELVPVVAVLGVREDGFLVLSISEVVILRRHRPVPQVVPRATLPAPEWCFHLHDEFVAHPVPQGQEGHDVRDAAREGQ